MIGDGTEYENPTTEESGELIDTIDTSDIYSEDDTGLTDREDSFYETTPVVADETEDNTDIVDDNVERINKAKELKDEAHDTLIALLSQALEDGEITLEMNAEIKAAEEQYTENTTIIKDTLGDVDSTDVQQQLLDLSDSAVKNLQDLLNLLNNEGRNKLIFADEDGRLYIEGEQIPKLTLIELDVQKLFADYAEITELVAKKASIEYLEANYATIQTLQANYATINSLNAANAEIETLKSSKADIDYLKANYTTTETLEANYATVKVLDSNIATINNALINKANVSDLNATNAEITNLKSSKADITDLTSANANITQLQSLVADIQTLIGGNLTMDNIQSLVLTSDKVTIADALIKNAMIDSISANKITTGTINTNNVSIQSEDGSMLINGTTQQFKDENNVVRIQIGKDASGNFTFCLFSQDGVGILLDETGIHAGAVPDGLIVNDMVSDTANISGSKLDITSVISEINGSTSTIKSSQIYFDDSSQTLQVAFNQLKNKVDTIESVTIDGDLSSVIEQVSTNTTNIEIAQGQISSLISNTTITKENGSTIQLKDDYNSTKDTVSSHETKIGSLETNYNTLSGEISSVSSKQSTLEQDLDTFKTTVSSVYTTKDEFNALEIGGTNLVKNSIFKDNSYWSINSSYASIDTTMQLDGYNSIKISESGQTSNVWHGVNQYNVVNNAKIGDTFTISGYYYVADKSLLDTTFACELKGLIDSVATNAGAYLTWSADTCAEGEWRHFDYTITLKKDFDSLFLFLWVKQNGTVWFTKLKVEKGNKATDWCLNSQELQYGIDDVNNNISTNYSTTTQMNSAIEQKANEVKTTVSETYATKETVTNLSNNLANNYSTTSAMNSAIDQKSNEILSSVSESYVTTSEFNNLEIGGRNMLKGTATDKGTITGTNSANQCTDLYYFTDTSMLLGQTVTISFKYTTTDYTGGTFYMQTAGSPYQRVGVSTITPSGNGTFTWTSSSTIGTTSGFNRIALRMDNFNGTLKIEPQTMKIELGNKATTWTPAPEDVDSSINAVDSKFSSYSTTSEMNSAIDQKASSILSTVSSTYATQTTVNDLSNNLSKNYSTTSQMNTAIDQKASSILSTVSSTYTTKSDFNNLQVGGTNLIRDSRWMSDTYEWYVRQSDGVYMELAGTGEWSNYNCYKLTRSTTSSSRLQGFHYFTKNSSGLNRIEWNVGDTYTLSGYFCVTETDGNGGNSIAIRFMSDSTNYKDTAVITVNENSLGATGKWVYKSVTFTVPDMSTFYNVCLIFSLNTTGTIYACKLKLERGNKATSWTPAPEDGELATQNVADNLANNYSTTTQMNTAIDQKANEVKTTVSEIYTTKTDFNNLQVGARNYLCGTSTSKSYAVDTTSYETYDPYNTYNNQALSALGWTTNDYLTISFDWEISNATKYGNFRVEAINTSGNYITGIYNSVITLSSSNTSGHFKYTTKVTSALLNMSKVRVRVDSSTLTFVIKNCKLEKGNKETSWSPAPEDVQAQLDNITSTYAKTSDLTQTASDLTAKFTTSGGYNLIENSSGCLGLDRWYSSGLSNFTVSNGNDVIANYGSGTCFVAYNTATTEKFAYSYRFLLKPNTTYTLSGKVSTDSNSKGIDIFVLASNSITTVGPGDLSSFDTAYQCCSISAEQWWKPFSYTFKTGSSCKSATIRVDNNGSTTSGTSCAVYFGDLLLTEGSVTHPWSPHPSECYTGVTRISGNGVKVSQSNYSGYTNMRADGFWVNDGNEDVISISSSGAKFKGNVTITGGSVPDSVLSSTITTGASNGTSAKSTLDSNSTNWINTYNRVKEWASSAITGSTTINGGMITSGTITAKQLYLGDLTNYCNLREETASLYGFSYTTDNGGTWYKANTLQRDTCISGNKKNDYTYYKCNGGESFRIKYQFKSSVKSASTSGGTDSVYTGINVGCYGKKTDGSKFYTLCSGGTSDSSLTVQTVSATITIPSDAVSFGVFLQMDGWGNWSGECYIRNVSVTKMSSGELIVDGSITADKIQGKELVGVTLRNSSNTFSVDANGNVVGATISGGTISGTEVTGDIFSVEGQLTADSVVCNNIDSAKYPATLDSTVDIYVNTSTGDDDNEIADGVKYASLQGAINAIPRFMNGKTVRITLESNITENVQIYYFTAGAIRIYFNGKTLSGTIKAYACSSTINIYGGTTSSTTGSTGVVHPNTGLSFGSRSTSLGFESCTYIALYKLKVYAPDNLPSGVTNTDKVCVAAQAGTGNVYCSDIAIVNAVIGFRANNLGHIQVASSSGMASKYGYQAVTGGTVGLHNASQAGGVTANTNKDSGGFVWYDSPTFETGSATSDSSTSGSVSTTKTLTIKSTSGDTYRSTVYNNWKKDGTVRQGDYGYGDCNGCWFFGSAFADVKGKTISKVQITITRQSGGTSSAVGLVVKSHGHASRPSGSPTYRTTAGTLSLATGATGTLTITNSTILSEISAGTVKGFGIQSSYTSALYAVCSGSCTVKITYTE